MFHKKRGWADPFFKRGPSPSRLTQSHHSITAEKTSYKDTERVLVKASCKMVPAFPTKSMEKLFLKTFQEVLRTSKVDFGVETILIKWSLASLDIIKLRGHIKHELSFQDGVDIIKILTNLTVRSLAQALIEKSTDPESLQSSSHSPIPRKEGPSLALTSWLRIRFHSCL
jgi:hypothetical protein